MKIDFSRVRTAEDQARTAAIEARKAEARRLLAETDWYVIRKLETGASVPKDVIEARRAARETLSND